MRAAITNSVTNTPSKRPLLSDAGLSATYGVRVHNQFNQLIEKHVPGEVPLTIKIDGHELVTLMTLGTCPELLTLGYIRNQGLFDQITDIQSVQVDWERELVEVSTRVKRTAQEWKEKLKKRIVTSGCGQGTIFSCTLDRLYTLDLTPPKLKQSELYQLIQNAGVQNLIYRQAGSVHGCALCDGDRLLIHIEDVGRHNAADAISGKMWLDDIQGAGKLFYSTGRLTSEIVMKAALMGIPALLSRSGITNMGLELAQELGVTLIARAKGKHFLVYHGAEHIEFDAIPAMPMRSSEGART